MRAHLPIALSIVATLLTSPAATAGPPPPTTTVTLLTGDTVALSATGSVAVTRGPGREHVPITKYEQDGHLHVVPADAGRLIAPAGSTPGCSTSPSWSASATTTTGPSR